MLGRKKKKEPSYEDEMIGVLGVRRVQLPHTITDEDQHVWKVLTWRFCLQIKDGPIFFERSYVKGSLGAIQKFNSMRLLFKHTWVESESEARLLFYRELHEYWFRNNQQEHTT